MARPAKFLYRLSAQLVCRTPLHIGGIGGDEESDLSLARDGLGRFYVPGTSLAGALRAAEAGLWGSHCLGEEPASRVVVRDAYLYGNDYEIREGVRIDGQSGTAAFRGKFNRAVVPRGTTFNVEIEIKTEQDAMAEIRRLVTKLSSGRLRLGARKTAGLGRVELHDREKIKARTYALNQREATLSLLGLADSPPVINIEIDSSHDAMELEWVAHGPVMVKANLDGFVVDSLPLTSQSDSRVALVIPGSSIKGAMRATATLIVRTIRGDQDLALVNLLFGPPATHPEGARQGALLVDDCYSVETKTAEEWMHALDATSKDAIQAAGSSWSLAIANHVAIDRWTGGAAESKLFSLLEPRKVAWEPIRLDLEVERLGSHANECFGLLRAVLREFRNRRVALGFGANRGLGDVELLHIPERLMADDISTAWREWCTQN